jgi:hypothetical protein
MPSSEITSGKAPMRKKIWNRLDALKNPDEYNQIYDSALPNIGMPTARPMSGTFW